jgi:hypothetical protein
MKQKIILLAALLLAPLSDADAKAKVFILSGQSNMSGGGPVAKEGFQFEPAVADKVRIWDATAEWGKRGIPGKWATLNELQAIKTEARMHMIGPEFGFAKAMTELYPAEEIHFIKVSRGGTAIDLWLPDAKGKENELTKLLVNMKTALEKIEGDYEIKGMLWMQGESDPRRRRMRKPIRRSWNS